MKKRVGAVSLIAAGSVVLALGGPGALVLFKTAAAAAADVSVAFVVDLGGGNVKTACVKVPSTDNEYAALAAFTQQENETAPTYNDSGLLCSIAGVPATGCGQAVDGRYIYWSYWHGDSGSWMYSNAGASGLVHTCNTQGQDCDVEGWKFENPGAGNPTDPPPGTAPDYAAICSATVTTTTGVSTPTSTTPTTTATTSTTTVSSPTTTVAPRSPITNPGTSPTTQPLIGALISTTPGGPSTASSANPDAAAPSSGALASTGFGRGDLSLTAIGAGLVLLGMGFFLLEDAPRRVRLVFSYGGSGRSVRRSPAIPEDGPKDLLQRKMPVSRWIRGAQRVIASDPGRIGRWMLGRRE